MATEVLSASSPISEWRLTDAIVVGLVLVTATWLGVWFAPSARTILPAAHATYYQRYQVSLLIGLAAQVGGVALAVIAIGRLRSYGDLPSSIGWNLNRSIVVCALLGLSLAAVITLAPAPLFGGRWRFPDGFAPLSILLYCITTVLIQPLVEECYFRGILFIPVSARLSKFGSVALTSLLFSLFHVGGYRFILVFFSVGMVLGITRIKTRSVAACFGLHAAYNAGILVSALLRIR